MHIDLEILRKRRSLASDFMRSYLISKVDDASESMVNIFYHLEYYGQNGKKNRVKVAYKDVVGKNIMVV